MVEKTPVRVNYDGSGNPTGFAELQSTEFVGLDDGGTGGSYASLSALLEGIGLGTSDSPTFAALQTIGNVTIGGTLTYEDVTSIDAVGFITAREGINVGVATQTGVGVTFLANGSGVFAGIVTVAGDLNVGSASSQFTELDVATIRCTDEGYWREPLLPGFAQDPYEACAATGT